MRGGSAIEHTWGVRDLLRGTRYLLGGLPSAVTTLLAPPLLAAVALSSGFAGLGLFAFPRAMVVLRRWAEWHRRRAAAYLGVAVTPRDLVLGEGLRARWRQVQQRERVVHGDHGGAAVRVVIAEDNVLLSAGLELLLGSKGIEVAAIVTDEPGLVAAVDEHAPDAVIADVRLPPSFRDEGIRAALEVRRAHPGLPVLVLSQYVEKVYARELLSDGRGGVGYLLKDRVSRVSEFVGDLRRVADGGTVMDPEVITQLMAGGGRSAIDALTNREREVLTLMAQGLGNTEIGKRLFVTDNAVHKHIGNIFAKLGLPAADGGHRRVLAVLAYLNSS